MSKFFYIRRNGKKWARTAIAKTSHPFNSAHLDRDSEGNIHSYLITGKGESVSPPAVIRTTPPPMLVLRPDCEPGIQFCPLQMGPVKISMAQAQVGQPCAPPLPIARSEQFHEGVASLLVGRS